MKVLAYGVFALTAAAIVLPAAAQQRPTPSTRPATPPPAQKPIATKSPDLVPIASRMLQGGVSIRNAGSADSPASVATVVCQKLGGGGGCAESPAMKPYENGAYPNALVVNIPALPAGQVHTHMLPFWPALKWAAGNYQFTVTADAGKQVGESNEGNNVGVTQMKK